MHLTKSELILLRYLDGSKQGDRVPNYFQYTHNLDAEECIPRFLQDGYLSLAPMAFVLGRATVAELKAVLGQCNVDQTGKKAVLIERFLTALPESVLQGFFPAKYYMLTEKGQAFLEDGLSDEDYYKRYPQKPTYTPEERTTKRLLSAQQEVMLQQQFELEMKAAGLETLYRIVTMDDERTCSACRRLENVWLTVDEIQIGTNFPPFEECTSAYCRCIVEWETHEKPSK